MEINTIERSTVLVREFEVTTRIAGEGVGDLEFARPGLLVESLLGRYVLDRDAREVWFRIDGCRSVTEIVDAVAVATGRESDDVREPILTLLGQLRDYGLVLEE